MNRKFLLLFVFAIAAGHLLQAQVKKGTILLGGDLIFSNMQQELDNNTYKTSSKGLTVWPTVGKAIKDNLIVGVFALYNHSRNKTNQGFNNEVNYFGAGVFVRQYLPVIDRLYLFGQCHLWPSYNYVQNDHMSGHNHVRSWGVSLGVFPGLSFAVNKKLHLESGFMGVFDAGFTHFKTENLSASVTEITRSNSFRMGVNLNNGTAFRLGVRYLISKS